MLVKSNPTKWQQLKEQLKEKSIGMYRSKISPRILLSALSSWTRTFLKYSSIKESHSYLALKSLSLMISTHALLEYLTILRSKLASKPDFLLTQVLSIQTSSRRILLLKKDCSEPFPLEPISPTQLLETTLSPS